MTKNNRNRAIAAIAALGLLFLPLRSAQSRLGHSSRGLRYQRNQSRDEARGAYERASSLNYESEGLRSQLQDAQRLLLQANEIYQDYYSQLKHTEAQIVRTRRRIEVAENQYSEHRKLFGDRLVAIQRGGRLGYLQMLLGTQTLSDLTRRIYLLNALTERDAQLQAALQADREELVAARNSLDSQWQDRNRLARASSEEHMRIAMVETQKEQVLSQIDSSRDAALVYAGDREQSSEELTDMIDQLASRREAWGERREARQEYATGGDAAQDDVTGEATLERRASRREVTQFGLPAPEPRQSFVMEPGELKPMPIHDITYQDKMEPEGQSNGTKGVQGAANSGHAGGGSAPASGR